MLLILLFPTWSAWLESNALQYFAMPCKENARDPAGALYHSVLAMARARSTLEVEVKSICQLFNDRTCAAPEKALQHAASVIQCCLKSLFALFNSWPGAFLHKLKMETPLVLCTLQLAGRPTSTQPQSQILSFRLEKSFSMHEAFKRVIYGHVVLF